MWELLEDGQKRKKKLAFIAVCSRRALETLELANLASFSFCSLITE